MRWRDEQRPGTSADVRRVQAMMRRAAFLVALASVVVMAFTAWVV
ncbi:morphogenic membrane protein MmpB [Streptomyces sp. HPF1205]|nr:hypothetical protein [Streptomyces sp. HPF1205]